MPNNERAAVVHLRMAPQLRDALRRAADNAGCSMNSYAVQVLATSTGDPAAFRTTIDGPAEISRPAQERLRRAARQEWMEATAAEIGFAEAGPLLRRYDAEDPGYFLTWKERRDKGAS